MRKKKKVEAKAVEEQEPHIDHARPPALSERVPVEVNPIQEFTEETDKEPVATQDPKLKEVFNALMGIPGISAKLKFQIFSVVSRKLETEDKTNEASQRAIKASIVVAVGSIRGVDETKLKTIQKVLDRAL